MNGVLAVASFITLRIQLSLFQDLRCISMSRYRFLDSPVVCLTYIFVMSVMCILLMSRKSRQ